MLFYSKLNACMSAFSEYSGMTYLVSDETRVNRYGPENSLTHMGETHD